jgi:serine palmitoyltransferase
MSTSYASDLIDILAHSMSTAEATFYSLPGSGIIERYVRSSHKNDPGRTFLELLLFFFVLRTLMMSRTTGDKSFIDFSAKVPYSIVPLAAVAEQF